MLQHSGTSKFKPIFEQLFGGYVEPENHKDWLRSGSGAKGAVHVYTVVKIVGHCNPNSYWLVGIRKNIKSKGV